MSKVLVSIGSLPQVTMFEKTTQSFMQMVYNAAGGGGPAYGAGYIPQTLSDGSVEWQLPGSGGAAVWTYKDHQHSGGTYDFYKIVNLDFSGMLANEMFAMTWEIWHRDDNTPAATGKRITGYLAAQSDGVTVTVEWGYHQMSEDATGRMTVYNTGDVYDLTLEMSQQANSAARIKYFGNLGNYVYDDTVYGDDATAHAGSTPAAAYKLTGDDTSFAAAAHASAHENGGADEISVLGLSGLLADGQTPIAHATSHQNGGSDEISVTGLSGTLADAQTPTSHAASHANAGGDDVNHDTLANFVANEHIDHSAVSITAGTDLTGGGTIAATRTLNVDSATAATVSKIVKRDANGDIFGVDLHASGVVNANKIYGVSDLGFGIEAILVGNLQGDTTGGYVAANEDYTVVHSGTQAGNYVNLSTKTYINFRDAVGTLVGRFDAEGNQEMHKFISSRLGFAQNVYDDGTEKYIQTAEAYKMTFSSGKWTLYKAASGTADTAISWTEVVGFSVDGSDELLIDAPGSFGHAEGDEISLKRIAENPREVYNYFDNFNGDALDASWNIVTAGAGSGQVMNNQATGAVNLKSGSVALAHTLMGRGTTSFKYYRHTSRCIVRTRVYTTITAGDNISQSFGFTDGNFMTLATNRVLLTFNPTINANWIFETYNGTTTNTTTSAIAGTGAHQLEILWEAGNAQAWIDDTLIATYTTNVPTGQTFAAAEILQGASATSRLFYLYYFNIVTDGL